MMVLGRCSRQRVWWSASYLYGCAANYLRGADICANSLEIPMAMADGAVLQMVEESILTPTVIEEAIDLALGPSLIARQGRCIGGTGRTSTSSGPPPSPDSISRTASLFRQRT